MLGYIIKGSSPQTLRCRVTLASEVNPINSSGKWAPALAPPRAVRGQPSVLWGWHPSSLINERAFWITSQVVVRRWGEEVNAYQVWGSLWDAVEEHLGIIQDLIMRHLGEETKAQKWRNHHALQRNKHGNRGIGIKGASGILAGLLTMPLSDHALVWSCPMPDHGSLSCVLIKLHFWLIYWVRDSIFWCCWHSHECRSFSLCCPVWLVVCTCTCIPCKCAIYMCKCTCSASLWLHMGTRVQQLCHCSVTGFGKFECFNLPSN